MNRSPVVVIEKVGGESEPTHTYLRHGEYRKTDYGYEPEVRDVDPLAGLILILDKLGETHVGSDRSRSDLSSPTELKP